MFSGSLSIVLQEPASWEGFETNAIAWINKLGATLIGKADTVDERVWSIEYKGKSFWISYDDWQSLITLEPKEQVKDEEILKIAKEIEKLV